METSEGELWAELCQIVCEKRGLLASEGKQALVPRLYRSLTATDLFTRLSKFYGPQTTVSGVGDEAYFDKEHALHVRKGRARFFLNLEPLDSASATERQLRDLTSGISGRL